MLEPYQLGAQQRGAEMQQDELREAYQSSISRLATGVSVITTRAPDGLSGMTASAVASLSLQPLQLLVCIASHLPTAVAIQQSGAFAVNVLADQDEELAIHFATRQSDKFAAVGYSEEHGVPVLDAAMAYFVCDVAEALPGGDHTIFVGDVRDCHSQSDRSPLIYFDRGFGSLRRHEYSAAARFAEELRQRNELVMMW